MGARLETDREHELAELPPALAEILDQVSYRRVRSTDHMDPIFHLRYKAYRREEFIPSNTGEVLEDQFDPAPNAMSYGVYIGEQLVSSVRIHHVTQQTPVSPSRTLWPEVLNPILDAGMSYIDPTRFTVDHEASLMYPALPYLTLRIAAMASVHFEADYCISAIRQEHAAFYRRVFRSRKVGEERIFKGLFFPMVLYMTDVAVIRDDVYRRYPVFMSTPEERHALFESPGKAVFGQHIKASVRQAVAQRIGAAAPAV